MRHQGQRSPIRFSGHGSRDPVPALLAQPEDWTEPGAFEVAPGVHRIPLPLPGDALKAVNVYALTTGHGLVMVDSGWAMAGAEDALGQALRQIGHRVADINRFLVTHSHRDHYTLGLHLRERCGTRVELGTHEKTGIDELRSPGVTSLAVVRKRLRAAGAVELADHPEIVELDVPVPPDAWQYPDAWLSDGDVLHVGSHELQVTETPGHTRGHVVFSDDERRLLFAGDHVLPRITPSIAFEPSPPANPLNDFLRSLERVRRQPDRILLPAHGSPAPSSHARIDELLAHHASRLQATLNAVRDGSRTAWEASQRLTWTRHERRLEELEHFNRALAVLETEVHFSLLVSQGHLAATTVGGELRYDARA